MTEPLGVDWEKIAAFAIMSKYWDDLLTKEEFEAAKRAAAHWLPYWEKLEYGPHD